MPHSRSTIKLDTMTTLHTSHIPIILAEPLLIYLWDMPDFITSTFIQLWPCQVATTITENDKSIAQADQMHCSTNLALTFTELVTLLKRLYFRHFNMLQSAIWCSISIYNYTSLVWPVQWKANLWRRDTVWLHKCGNFNQPT